MRGRERDYQLPTHSIPGGSLLLSLGLFLLLKCTVCV